MNWTCSAPKKPQTTSWQKLGVSTLWQNCAILKTCHWTDTTTTSIYDWGNGFTQSLLAAKVERRSSLHFIKEQPIWFGKWQGNTSLYFVFGLKAVQKKCFFVGQHRTHPATKLAGCTNASSVQCWRQGAKYDAKGWRHTDLSEKHC